MFTGEIPFRSRREDVRSNFWKVAGIRFLIYEAHVVNRSNKKGVVFKPGQQCKVATKVLELDGIEVLEIMYPMLNLTIRVGLCILGES